MKVFRNLPEAFEWIGVNDLPTIAAMIKKPETPDRREKSYASQ